MRKRIHAAAMLLACFGRAAACDCNPATLAFQDAFFKYCDHARESYVTAATFPASDPEHTIASVPLPTTGVGMPGGTARGPHARLAPPLPAPGPVP